MISGKAIRLLAMTLLVAGVSVPAQAAAISISPAAQTVNIGNSVFFDVAISGIDTATPDPIAAFDLTLSFNPAILGGGIVTLLSGNPGAMGAAPDTFITPAAGSINFGAALVDPAILTAGDLSAVQGGSFVAARFQFTALAAGVSALTVAVNGGGLAPFDFFANLIVPTVDSGQVTVQQNGTQPPAPEPATLLLVGTGVVLAAARRRMRRQ